MQLNPFLLVYYHYILSSFIRIFYRATLTKISCVGLISRATFMALYYCVLILGAFSWQILLRGTTRSYKSCQRSVVITLRIDLKQENLVKGCAPKCSVRLFSFSVYLVYFIYSLFGLLTSSHLSILFVFSFSSLIEF